MPEANPWIKTKLIIEIAGFPQEHVDAVLAGVAENFAKENKEVKVTGRKIREAKQIKMDKVEKTQFFSGFVEIECDAEKLATLIGLIFDWMPSSIEIIEPEKISENTAELTGLLNDLTAKLHEYDSIVKKLRAQSAILGKELKKTK